MNTIFPTIRDIPDAVLSIFRQHKKFVLTTHVNPDGDGLGSEVALAEWLTHQGVRADILNHSATPAMYQFLNRNGLIRTFDASRDAHTVAEADVIVVLDTNHTDRLRSMQQHVMRSPAQKLCIDHHLDAAPFADYYLLDEEAAATGEILYHVLRKLDPRSLSPQVATALYCAIMTDTGSFRYPRTDSEIHRIIAHLIDSGADPVSVYQSVYEQWSVGRIQLLGETLASLRTEYGGRLSHVTVTQEVLRRTGTLEEDTDNFTIYPMSVEGAVIGILFLELNDGVKISFRSKGDIPINQLAQEFGGNGHKNAAGGRVLGQRLENVKASVVAAAARYLEIPVTNIPSPNDR